MKSAIRVTAVIAGVVLAVMLAMFIRKSADSIDVSTENDTVITANSGLPDGLEVFSDGNGVLPPLWKAEKDGSVIYMMGSIHAGDKSIYPLDSRVKKAYDECDKVAVEHKNVDIMDMFSSDTGKDHPSVYEDGDELKNHLSGERYKLLTDAASKAGYDLEKLNKMQLWAVYTGIASIITPMTPAEQKSRNESSIGGKYGIDRVFQILANIDKKQKLSIETDEEKSSFYPEMPESVLGLLLEERLKGENDISDMINAYKAGDLDKLYNYNYDPSKFSETDREAYDKLIEYSLTDRNRKMADRALEYLENGGKVFFIVGSAHYCGEEGIPELLTASGCTVARIS